MRSRALLSHVSQQREAKNSVSAPVLCEAYFAKEWPTWRSTLSTTWRSTCRLFGRDSLLLPARSLSTGSAIQRSVLRSLGLQEYEIIALCHPVTLIGPPWAVVFLLVRRRPPSTSCGALLATTTRRSLGPEPRCDKTSRGNAGGAGQGIGDSQCCGASMATLGTLGRRAWSSRAMSFPSMRR